MKKIILALALCLFAGLAQAADPTITEIGGFSTDYIDSTYTITIIGSNFGTHDLSDVVWGAGPNGWIEAQDIGTTVDELVDADTWERGFSSDNPAVISSERFWSGTRALDASVDQAQGTGWQKAIEIYRSGGYDKIYVSYMLYFNPTDIAPWGSQLKHWYASPSSGHSVCGSVNGTAQIDSDLTMGNWWNIKLSCCMQGCTIYQDCWLDVVPVPYYPPTLGAPADWQTTSPNLAYEYHYLGIGQQYSWDATHPKIGGWTRIEMYLDQSTDDTADGWISYYITKEGEGRIRVVDYSGVRTNSGDCFDQWHGTHIPDPQPTWKYWGLMGFFDDNGRPGSNPLEMYPSDAADIFYDDIVVQFGTRARVEVLNASTHETATKSALLEPVYWAATGDTIQAKLDLAGINPADAQIVITTEDDSLSTAFPLLTTCDVCTGGPLKHLQFVGTLVAAYNGGTTDACTDTITTTNPWTRVQTFNTGIYNVEMTTTWDDTLTTGASCPNLGTIGDASAAWPLAVYQCRTTEGLASDRAEQHEFCATMGDGKTISYVAWEDSQWISDWAFRAWVTADSSLISGNGELVDFPVVILLDSSNSDIFTKANSDGSDIRFYNPDGIVSYDYELVSWDATAQTAEFWVKIPTFSKTLNNLWIYYGYGAATSASSSATWSDYKAVYHYSDDPATNTLTDSSPTGADGTAETFRPSEVPEGWTGWDSGDLVDAKIGKGWVYESDQTVYTLGISVDDATPKWTVGAWLNHSNHGTDFFLHTQPWYFHLSSQAADTSPTIEYNAGYASDPDFRNMSWLNGGVRVGEWHHYLWVYDASVPSMKSYYDGALRTDTNYWTQTAPGEGNTDAWTAPTTHWINPDGDQRVSIVGPMWAQDPNGQFGVDGMDGTADEYHFRAEALTAHWIKTMYNNQDDPAAFWSFGAEKTP